MTDIERSYTHPVFTIDPIFCPFEYTFEQTTLTAGDSAITGYIPDETKFTYQYDKDLLALGQTQTVTVTATSNSKYVA